MQRRTFLKRGLVGGALLALSAAGLALWPGDRSAAPRRPLAVLSPRAFPVLVAVAARVLQGTTADPVEIAARIDQSLLRASPEAQRDLNRVLMLLENALGGLLLRQSPRPFTLLSSDEQDAALLQWRGSSVVLLRGAYQSLRKLCLGAHWAVPLSGKAAGYAGPSIAKADPPPIEANKPLAVELVAEVLP